MGRKGGGKGGRKSAGALSSEDEGDRWSEADSEASFLSADVAAHGGGEEADGGEEAGGGVSFLEAVEMLSEKRTSTREAGLRTVLSALRAYSCVDVLQANKETTMANLVPLIKRAGNGEGQLLAQALGLVMLLLGPEEDAAFAEIMAPLEFVVTRSSHADYRVEAINALALSCFIASSEEEVSLEVLGLLDGVFTGESEGVKASDEIKAAAVDGWCLLATVAPRGYMTDGLRNRLLITFYELLSSPCAELKLAAGEALAWLNEYWIEAVSGFEYPEEEEEVVDAIVQKLQDLAREGSKKISRKERKQQRSSFREVHRAFAESEPPEETISFRTKSFRLSSWAKIKQMEAIRDCLQGGFLSHLELNPTIHDIFEIPSHIFTEVQDRRVVDKTSEVSKLRTCARTRNRRSRETAKQHFLEEDGGGGAEG